MKRKILFFTQIVFLGLFIFSAILTVFMLLGNNNPLSRFDHSNNGAVYNHIEAYDPSLSRLSSIEKTEKYCDSIYATKALTNTPAEFERTYADIVSTTIRNRFFHGYSYYGVTDNYVAAIIAKFTIPGLSALVIPDEILKHPFAACSQQSIVMMEILKSKGLKTRKVGFVGKNFGGHFAFEVFYNGSWHFQDPDMEPNKEVLGNYEKPSIEFLAQNPDILLQAYSRLPREKVLDIFPNYFYGPVNKFPAPKAIIFQKATLFLSYSIWAFFLIGFIITRYGYLRFKRKTLVYEGTPVRQMQSIPTSAYYPDYKAQGT